MSKLEIAAKLDEALDRDQVSQRQAGGGVTLDYVSGYYVIDRLNKVIGIGNWSYDVTKRDCVYQGEIEGRFHANYLSEVSLYVNLGEGTVRFTDVGYGDGMDKKNPGKAHELASKESVTDALKRCAKNLGMSMGLALYDKEQTNVKTAPKPVAPKSSVHEKIKALGSVAVAKRRATIDELKKLMLESFGVMETAKLTVEQANAFAEQLEELIK